MNRIDREAVVKLLEAEPVAATLSPDQQERLVQWVASADTTQREPIMMKLLAGVGAWFASLFLLSWLFAGVIDRAGGGAMILGGLILGGSIPLSRRRDNVFMEQAALAIALAGNAMILLGLAQLMERDAFGFLTIAQVIIATVTWEFIRQTAYRFIAAASVFFLATVFVFQEDAAIGLYGVLGLEIACAALVAVPQVAQRFMPAVYAAALMLAGTVVYLVLSAQGGWLDSGMPVSDTPILVMLALAAVGLVSWLYQHGQVTVVAAVAAVILALLLAIVSTPGVVLAILLLAVGQACGDRILAVAGSLLLPLFLVHYYYAMDVTLAAKSLILLASGGLLLLTLWASKWASQWADQSARSSA